MRGTCEVCGDESLSVTPCDECGRPCCVTCRDVVTFYGPDDQPTGERLALCVNCAEVDAH